MPFINKNVHYFQASRKSFSDNKKGDAALLWHTSPFLMGTIADLTFAEE